MIGPGVGSETSFARSAFPGPVNMLSLHAPECEINQAIVGDVHDMALPSGLYGFLFACNVLEHVIAPYAALMECRRVLREDGTAYFIVPSFEGYEGGAGPFHLHCGYGPQWEELMRKAGFEPRLAASTTGDVNLDHYDHVVCRAVPLKEPHASVMRELRRNASRS